MDNPTDIYSQLHHKDGRVENWHYQFYDRIHFDNLVKELAGKVDFIPIPEEEFNKQYYKAFKVNVHADRLEPGDAEGDYLGYVEHYSI